MALTISSARLLDAGRLAEIMGLAQEALPWLPRIYTGAEDIRHCDRMIAEGWVSVAQYDAEIIGFSAESKGWIHAIYVLPQMQGKGIGSSLLEVLKDKSSRLSLNSYQQNLRANRFYTNAGFTERSRSDGSGNEWGLPDIHMEWKKEVS
jgi:GNAT superfamily N-acetyltransferase